MIRKIGGRWAVTLIGAAVVAAPCLGENTTYTVNAEHYECMVTHKNDYMGINKDPVVIFPSLCPTIKLTPRELAQFSSNSLPGMPTDPNAPSRYIPVPRTRLECVLDKTRGAVKPVMEAGKVKAYIIDQALCHD